MTVGIYAKQQNKSGDYSQSSIKPVHVFAVNTGYADLENLVEFNEHTLARIASISKCITSCLIAHLKDSGHTDWTSQIKDAVKTIDSVKPFEDVTIGQLLSHTAGVRGYCNNEFMNTEYFKTIESSISLFLKHSKKPDTLPAPYLYSSHGFCLLAFVIDEICKQTKYDNIKSFLKHSLREMYMLDTFIEEHESIISRRCKQYTFNDNKLRNCPFVRNDHKFASGGLLSTTNDLQRFGQFLLRASLGEEQFISKQSIEKMWTPVCEARPGCFEGYYYCYGWMKSSRQVFHTGGAVGGCSILMIQPFSSLLENDHSYAIVVAFICNLDTAKGLMTFATRIINLIDDFCQNLNIISYLFSLLAINTTIKRKKYNIYYINKNISRQYVDAAGSKYVLLSNMYY
ncbi:hypothetical protein GJ496_010855 [Pomphorhynchus laevis]|nr:hypothetical protein GJ496_010855 [Pomphorhynchus laevis]